MEDDEQATYRDTLSPCPCRAHLSFSLDPTTWSATLALMIRAMAAYHEVNDERGATFLYH